MSLSSPPPTPPLNRGPRRLPDVGWLRGLPVCRSEGPMVYVTFALPPVALFRPACLAWSAGCMHATTPRIKTTSITCGIPRNIFELGARVTLQVLDYAASEETVRAWTQIPVLEETVFRAGIMAGSPVLKPLAGPLMRLTSSETTSSERRQV